jgi:putative redox protein
MIRASAQAAPYLTAVSNGKFELAADTGPDHGGAGAGFRPHELLEAALAACINMTMRMYAERHNLKLDRIETAVEVDRSTAGVTTFRYTVDVEGPGLTPALRQRMLKVAAACPVHRTLGNEIRFEGALPHPAAGDDHPIS